MYRALLSTTVVALVLSVSGLARAGEQKMQRREVVRTARHLERVLASVEKAAVAKRPSAAKQIRNSTLQVQAYIAGKLVRSGQSIVILPTAMVAFILRETNAGMQRSALAKALLKTMQTDGFASEDAKLHGDK